MSNLSLGTGVDSLTVVNSTLPKSTLIWELAMAKELLKQQEVFQTGDHKCGYKPVSRGEKEDQSWNGRIHFAHSFEPGVYTPG